jgi:hypothetical protein
VQTFLAKLLRIGWRSVGQIHPRVAADKLDHGRPNGLEVLGVDEVSHGTDHGFLTCVGDQAAGGGVWAASRRNAACSRFISALVPA